MLETIREFAGERLRRIGDEDDLRRRHAKFFLSLAKSANLDTDTIDLGQRFEVVLPEQDNLRAAIDWAAESGDFVFALRIMFALDSLGRQRPARGRAPARVSCRGSRQAPARRPGASTSLLGWLDLHHG